MLCAALLLSALLFSHYPLFTFIIYFCQSSLWVSLSWRMCVFFFPWCFFFSSLPHLSYFFAVLIHSMSVFHLENFIKGERGSRGEAGEKFFLYFCWCITVVVWGGNQPSTTTANMLLRKKEFSQFRWTHNILLCSVSSAFLDFLVLLSFCCP